MKFSIIIPYYNNGHSLERLFITIQDYLNRDCEIIIIDDCSDVEEYQLLINKFDSIDSNNLRMLQNEVNSGPGFSRQAGVDAALGTYIAFLDADDGWTFNRAFILCDLMEKQGIDIIGGFHKQIDKSDFFELRSKDACFLEEYNEISFTKFLLKNYYATSSVIVKRDLFKLNRFDTRFRFAEDVELWRRMVFSGNAKLLIDSGLFCFKHVYLPNEKNSLSNQITKMSKSELLGLYILFFNSKIPIRSKALIPAAMTFSIFKHCRRVVQIEREKLLK